jgi:hypothetical protein
MLNSLAMLAYLGPGGVLSAIGSFLALLVAVVLALFGFVWYPLKRLLRARKSRRAVAGALAQRAEPATASAAEVAPRS